MRTFVIAVSILARPFERALRHNCLPNRRKHGFQSSPALSSGRYEQPWQYPRRVFCFNPRPPFRAGATACRLEADEGPVVSILARPFERALQPTMALMGEAGPVSILARPFERALQVTGAPYVVSSRFQSSPALSSGRYLSVRAAW